MKNKRFIKFNFYPICDIILLLILVCFYFAKKGKIDISTLSVCVSLFGLCFIILFYLQAGHRPASVKNNSNKTIKAKPEDKDKDFLINVEPRSKVFQIDGIKVENKTYKIPDSVHAKVTKNNKVCINSFCAYIVYLTFGGGVLDVSPDKKWDKLFNS